jgi:hypothetical protein
LRSLAEKELGFNVVSMTRGSVVSLDGKGLSKKQANGVMKNFLGDNPNVKHETFINRFLAERKSLWLGSGGEGNAPSENVISPYELFLYSLTEYKKFRDHLKTQELGRLHGGGSRGLAGGNYIDNCVYQTFSGRPELNHDKNSSFANSFGGSQSGHVINMSNFNLHGRDSDASDSRFEFCAQQNIFPLAVQKNFVNFGSEFVPLNPEYQKNIFPKSTPMNCPEENYFLASQYPKSDPSQKNSPPSDPKPDSNPESTSRTDEFYNPSPRSPLSDSEPKYNKDAQEKLEQTFLVEMELMIGEYPFPFPQN